ncbi:DUF6263 family protein [Mucilaginibacter pocheonensis]|uniref:Uncharacterized protein n=1 Tax=Mucilaginibacter pocheonensis TaxID=398050 RepID=A0ABU1T554_9SPHI|nr:DUF6263 family protein [Mucilaginibacter pocheonensis]MDR6940478.1 hypothetical protein [Mucilaginibacter pocheonensis]
MKHLFNLFILLIIGVTCQAQKLKLALHLTKDNTYNMITNATSTIKQTINGQVNNIELNITGNTSFKVLNADDSLYYMEVNYKSLSMKMQLPNGPVNINSQKNDPSDIMSSILGALVNKPFTAIFTKSGKIKSVENIENMISSVLDGFPQVQGPQKDQIKAQFIQSFGAKAIKGSIELATAVFPETPVSKNDKWTINTTLESAMTAKVTTVYQLTDITPTSFIIHGDANIATNANDDFKRVNDMPMKYNMTGTMTADIIADKITGWISESKTKQTISGTVEIKDNPKIPGGVTFPMSVINASVTTDK